MIVYRYVKCMIGMLVSCFFCWSVFCEVVGEISSLDNWEQDLRRISSLTASGPETPMSRWLTVTDGSKETDVESWTLRKCVIGIPGKFRVFEMLASWFFRFSQA